MSRCTAGFTPLFVALWFPACYGGANEGDSLGTAPGVSGATTLTSASTGGEPTGSGGPNEPGSTGGGSSGALTGGIDDMTSGTGPTGGPQPTTGVGETPADMSTSTTDAPPMTTTDDPPPPPPPSCAELAGAQGWQAGQCENNGNGACGGQGVATSDCQHCCAAPSCGQLAGQLGWGDDALCEQNGDGICKGTGQPTWDCQLCCDASGLPGGGFGYPVGDGSTYPAGGWTVLQVLSKYYFEYEGRHLAHDVRHAQGGAATVNAPVLSVADGVVRYAGPNTSQYKHMILIEHPVPGGPSICSFYGHINAPMVSTGQMVKRGQQITTVMDWAVITGANTGNTHLHYGLIRKALCDASAAAQGTKICGYDKGGDNGAVTLANEPFSYQPINDLCGTAQYGDVFVSPTQFIEQHHF